ncbi:MAG: hypothetical protein ACNS64_02280, partial [Candidatus Halalkalibacterium sp. M3_1C_030]
MSETEKTSNYPPQLFEVTRRPDQKTEKPKEFDRKTILKHLGLFLLTFASVSLVGASFVGFSPSLFPVIMPDSGDLWRGVLFATLLLGFLGVHEFGHF